MNYSEESIPSQAEDMLLKELVEAIGLEQHIAEPCIVNGRTHADHITVSCEKYGAGNSSPS